MQQLKLKQKQQEKEREEIKKKLEKAPLTLLIHEARKRIPWYKVKADGVSSPDRRKLQILFSYLGILGTLGSIDAKDRNNRSIDSL